MLSTTLAESSVGIEIKKFYKRDELRSIEEWAQRKWEAAKEFESNSPAVGAQDTGNKKDTFMGTFPYPYMNGRLHLGHSFSLSKVEFAMGYERLQGKECLFPFGFHCTGMPIKACADKLKREVELFGTHFERYSSFSNASEIEANDEPVEEDREVDPSKLVLKRKGKVAAKATGLKYQFLIMESMGVPRNDIHKFADSTHWLYYFPPIAKVDLKAFGLKVDWRRSFITTDANPYYDSFIRWQFNKLKASNKIRFGKRYTIYSPQDGQACMDHDRASGEGVGVQEYTGIKLRVLMDRISEDGNADFVLKNGKRVGETLADPKLASKLAGKRVFLVAATLRPETMYGQTNCFVGPELDYAFYAIKNSDEVWVTTERAGKNMAWQGLFGGEDGEMECLAVVKGCDLVGLPLKAPLAKFDKVYCLPMETVLATKGTGVVTSVPSDSPDDYMTLLDLQKKAAYYCIKPSWVEPFWPPVAIIQTPNYGNLAAQKVVEELKINSPKDKAQLAIAKEIVYKEGFYSGVMIVGPHAGIPVQEAKALIRQIMIESKMALTYCEPEGVVVSRSGDDCVVTLCDQWYLDYSDEEWKKDARRCLANMECYSSETRHGFEKTLDWLREWACSRAFGLGSRIPWDPTWLIESLSDSTIYMAYYTVAHLLQFNPDGSLDGRQMGPAQIKPEEMTDDVWEYIFNDTAPLPSASSIPAPKLEHLRREFSHYYPLDLRVSGKDLIGNHLSFFIFNHVAIFPEKYWPKSIRANGHLLLNSEKMSKSTGNFMTLSDSIEEYGADATRFALADAGDALEDANFLKDTANNSILRLYTQLEWIRETLKDLSDGNFRTGPKSFNDLVFESEMNKLILYADKNYKMMLYREALKSAFYDLQNARDWYRDVTSGNHVNREENEGMHVDMVLRFIEVQALLVAPICPHWSEHIWGVCLKKETSIMRASWPAVGKIDDSILDAVNFIRNLTHRIRREEDILAKKAKKRGEATPDEEKGGVKKGTLFVASRYPEWQDQVVEILKECWDPATKAIVGEMQKLKASGLLKDKKVMPFVQVMKKSTEALGKQGLDRALTFDELKTLKVNENYLRRALGLSEVKIVQSNEATEELDVQRAAMAMPAEPSYRSWTE